MFWSNKHKEHKHIKELIMTLFELVEDAQVKIAALQTATAPDLTPYAKETEVTALQTSLAALAALVGTPKATV
jgi:phage I-like protein